MTSTKSVRFRDIPSDVLQTIQSSRRGEDISALLNWGVATGFLSVTYYKNRARPLFHMTCDNCGKMALKQLFEVRKSLKQGSRDAYCSTACSRAHHAVKNSTNTCRHCGASVRDRHIRYCSKECKRDHIDQRVHVRWLTTCPQCGRQYSGKSKHCSRACADRAHSVRMAGVRNSRFVALGKYSNLFRQMSDIIRDRDGMSCSACGAQAMRMRHGNGGWRTSLQVHHLDENTRNNYPENLITLCARCHMKHHRGALPQSLQLTALALDRSASMTSKLKRKATSLLTAFSRTIALSSTTRT